MPFFPIAQLSAFYLGEIHNTISYAYGTTRLVIACREIEIDGGQTEALATPGGGLTIRFTLARF
jgi:hypothetical protein